MTYSLSFFLCLFGLHRYTPFRVGQLRCTRCMKVKPK
jgi:hypothetical protein